MLAAIFPFDTSKTEFKAFLLYTLFVAYGSTYPFDFRPEQAASTGLWAVLSYKNVISIGDVAANLVLFMPFGFLGVRAMKSPFRHVYYMIWITLCSLLFSYLLQYLQIFIPDRVPSSLDVILNTAGGLAAGVFSVVNRFRFFGGKRGLELWKSVPLLLAGLWPAGRLAPFLPSPDLGYIKDALKPLLLHPHLSVFDTLLHLAGWSVFGHMVSTHTGRPLKPRLMLLTVLAVFCGQVAVVERVLTLSDVVGGLAGVLMWIKLRRSRRPAHILLILIVAVVSIRGLLPFEVVAEGRNEFHWLPLYGFLAGDRLINVCVLFEKMFLYGSLIWLLEEAGESWWRAVFLCLAWLGSIEFAQL
ncbi:MAG: VanZ family protein, partial [Desulfobacteraceae bacterium]